MCQILSQSFSVSITQSSVGGKLARPQKSTPSFKMIIYKDICFGDELFTDAVYPKMDEQGICLTFNTKMITVKEGDIDGALLGANASAEEQQEESEVAVVQGFDFVLANRLCEVDPPIATKKDFQKWCKKYFKKVSQKLQHDEKKKADFEKQAVEFCKHFAGKVSDLSFYGAPVHEEDDDLLHGNVVLVEWNDDGLSGKAYCLKAALEEEKV